MKIEITSTLTNKKLNEREARNVLKVAFDYLHDMYRVKIIK
jgi:hypothetical protein